MSKPVDNVFKLASDNSYYDSTNYSSNNSLTPFCFKSIRLQDISFSYSKSQNYTLNNVNISIERGDIVGIIGSTGSGKSTLINIIMGLIEPSSGRIIVNGKTMLASKNLCAQYCKSLSLVPQDIYLRDASISDNISFAYGRNETSSLDDVIEASKVACAYDFIRKLPNSFDEKVGENGARLSGGEKQRIGIAREIYRRSQIYIFDEATSAIDFSTEKRIIRNILQSLSGTTIIMIAHRMSTLKHCNKIYEVKNGTVTLVDKTDLNFSK